jgi:uncharacterized protein (TIGR02453 family)
LPFKGWKVEALEFFDGLEVENTKAYWTRNKDTYENLVRAPMEELLVELAPQFGEGKIFRPYRDVRFSADKSPYKTAIGATVGGSGYVHFSASGLGVGAGCHVMASDQLARFREAVADDRSGEALVAAVSAVEAGGVGVSASDQLKRVPRGFDADHPRADLLRDKDLTAWVEWPVEPWLHTPEAEDRVVGALRASRPLTDWLDEHVGASELERSR